MVAEQEIEDARTLTRVLGEVSARELERIGRSRSIDRSVDGNGSIGADVYVNEMCM